MKIKRLIALVLTLVMSSCTLAVPEVFASNDVTYFFSESFNSYVTNITPDNPVVTGALKYRVVEDGRNNKALMVEGNSPQIKKDFVSLPDGNFIMSFDIKSGDGKLTFIPGAYYSDGTVLSVVTVRDNVMYTSNGKNLGTLAKNGYSNIAFRFNYELDVCDVFLNRKCVAENIPAANCTDLAGMSISITNVAGRAYVDNLAAYTGSRLLGTKASGGYSESAMDYIDFDDNAGSYEYWNMYYMNISGPKFQNVNLYPKDNVIETPRFDYKNPDRESWIQLKKTTNSDCYLDIITRDRHARLGVSNKRYKYFVLSGDFVSEKGLANAQFPMIRDSVSYGANADCALAMIRGRNIVLCDGTVLDNVVMPGQWFNYKVALNLIERTADVYINGEERAKGVPLTCTDATKSIDVLSIARISLTAGNNPGDLKMQNCTFTGYDKPYVHGEDPKTSIYYDDTPVGEYLKDKITFHGYAENLMVNDVKYDIADHMTYDEASDEITVKAAVLREKLGWNVSGDDYVSVKKYASDNGLYSASNKNGLVIISKEQINMDVADEYQWFVVEPFESFNLYHATIPEALDDYVFFDRPEAPELLEMMNKKLGSLDVHPRIYADKDRFDELRSLYKTDSTYKKWADVMIAEADKYADPATPFLEYKYQDQYRMVSVVHFKYLERFTALGFAYQMTGDTKYSDRAFKEFEKLATYPDINPSHLIDTGSMNEAVAIGYDWMYHAYTPEQRAFIEDTVVNMCIKPVASGFYGLFSAYCTANVSWYGLKSTNNYNTWIIGGLLAATCAFMESEPEYLSDVAEKSIRGLEYSIKGFAPDGAWLEGPDYWEHTTRYFIAYAGSVLNCFGDDFNMLKYQGMSEAPDWMMSISGMYGVNNFGDALSGDYTFDRYSFYSYYYGNKAAGSLRKYDIERGSSKPEIFDLVYYDPTVNVSQFDSMPRVITTRGTESCGIRESYDDERGMFFSAHGGANRGYHMHYDTGAFVFDLNGVRWAHDLGKDDYNTGLPDYQIYRKRSEAHNTVTFNVSADRDAMVNEGFAPIISKEYNDSSAYIVYDMSSVYAETDAFKRGFYIGDNYRSLTVRDEITLNTDSDVLWTMNTMADVALWGNEAILYENGEALHVTVDCDAPEWEFVDLPCQSIITLPAGATAQNPNAEYTKLAIKAKGTGSFNITVKLAAFGEAADAKAVQPTPISQWKLEDESVQSSSSYEAVNADIYADGELVIRGQRIPVKDYKTMPEIKVVPTTPGATYEIVNEAKDASDKTVVKVYSADKSTYTMYVVKYTDADMALWRTHTVYTVNDFTVSQEKQAENSGNNMFDGRMSSRWTSLNTGENVTVDLGEVKEVSALAMGFWQSEKRSYHYTVQISDDGVSFTTISSGSSILGPEGYHIYEFTPAKGRYVRVVGNGNTSNVNTNILELRVLGCK